MPRGSVENWRVLWSRDRTLCNQTWQLSNLWWFLHRRDETSQTANSLVFLLPCYSCYWWFLQVCHFLWGLCNFYWNENSHCDCFPFLCPVRFPPDYDCIAQVTTSKPYLTSVCVSTTFLDSRYYLSGGDWSKEFSVFPCVLVADESRLEICDESDESRLEICDESRLEICDDSRLEICDETRLEICRVFSNVCCSLLCGDVSCDQYLSAAKSWSILFHCAVVNFARECL